MPAGGGPQVGAIGRVNLPTRVAAVRRTVHGWAHVPGEEITGVVMLLDGELVAVAQHGMERPDVVQAHGIPDVERPGWIASVDLTGRAGKEVVISALVRTAAGRTIEIGQRRCSVVWPRRAIITSPDSGEVVAPTTLRVTGQVVMQRPVARVEVLVDGVAVGLARLEPAPGASPAAGEMTRFSMMVDLRQRRTGSKTQISCHVTDLDGAVAHSDAVFVLIDGEVAQTPADSQQLAAMRDRVVATAEASRDSRSTEQIRLLVVTHQLSIGGAQLYLLELLRHLVRQPDVSCVVVSPSDGPMRANLESLGVEVHVCAGSSRGGGYPLDSAEEYESRMFELALVASWHGCDVVLANTMVSGIGVDLAGRLGVPALWAIHESLPLSDYLTLAGGPAGVSWYVRSRLEAALATAAAVVFVAEATRQICLGDADPHRFVTISYGIDLDAVQHYRATTDRAALRAQQGIGPDEVVLLSVGTFEARKAQSGLAVAFAELADAHPAATLVMVGETGSAYSTAVRQVVDGLDLGDRIRLVPVLDDPSPWFVSADVFVLPSDFESMPRAILEAMAFGVPVLTTDAFGMSELISAGQTGYFCQPRDLSSLVEALSGVLDASPHERSSVAEAAERLVGAHYDRSGYVTAFLALLRGFHAHPTAFPGDFLGSAGTDGH